MERRLFLAVTLSLLVLLSWSFLTSKLYPTSKFYHIEQQRVIKKESIETEPSEPLLQPALVEEKLPEEKVFLDHQEISFDTSNAAISNVVFKDYQNHKFLLNAGFLLKEKSALRFQKETIGSNSFFSYIDPDKKVTKRFLFHNSNNTIELNIEIQNLKSAPLFLNPALILVKCSAQPQDQDSRFEEVIVSFKDRIQRLNPRRQFNSEDEIGFLAFRDRYFCAIIEPSESGFRSFVQRNDSRDWETGLATQIQLNPNETKEFRFLIYLGPQELRKITAVKTRWQDVVYYGTFDAVSKLFLKLLYFFYGILHNWGLALIILSVFLQIIFYPLMLKQMRSMKKMQELQPKIEELKKTHKDNPQKLNKEILDLYRREKINPFGGCLPLLLQMPVFFALYQALMRCIELKGASFLWIKDLSQPDRLIPLSQNLPFIGKEINLLPVLMAILMFLQQKMSQVSLSSAAAEQQRLMSVIFPLMLGAVFYRMPSGLVLYWTMNSLLMIIYQLKVKTR